MKGLYKFQSFRLDQFTKDKELLHLKVEPWFDGESNNPIGVKEVLFINKDDTDYGNPDITNYGEHLIVIILCLL